MTNQELYHDAKAAIFDLDGTLMDSMGIWGKIDREFFAARGKTCPEGYQRAVAHKTIVESAIYTKETYGFAESIPEICDIWTAMAKRAYAYEVKPKPYAKEYLAYVKAKGFKIGLASATKRELALACLKANGILDWFDVFLTAAELNTDKSKPTLYLEEAKRLGALPFQTLVFEDILMAIRTAKAAGFKTIGVQDPASAPDAKAIEAEADRYILSFRELMSD